MWSALVALVALSFASGRAPVAAPPVAVSPAEPAQQAEPAPLELEIDAVTLYRNSAMVHRRAKALTSGSYVVRGLPGEVSNDGTRVRFVGGHVIAVEVRERVLENAPTARIEELRVAREGARAELRAAQDDVAVTARAADWLSKRHQEECEAWNRQLSGATADPDGWRRNRAWFERALTDAFAMRRAAIERADAAQRALDALEQEWGRMTAPGGVIVQDLHLRVTTDHEAGRLEVDTRLPAAGWEPVYDLRAADDARRVELTYRARVRQETGEDWSDVRLLLSTAQPEMGAQGPDPVARWVDVSMPHRGMIGSAVTSEAAPSSGVFWSDDDGFAETHEAAVLQEGLSVRFELAQRESIQSRPEATTVLVARERFDVQPEHYCAPAASTAVWLRGRATNTGERTLLPGEASVFFGDDYLGRARMDLVQPGQEFTLHLGVVDAIEVERTRVHDRAEGPGLFGSKRALVEEWRVTLTNHGASVAKPDGSVDVIVQEALPRAGDDGIEVVVERESTPRSEAERWKTDWEDRSIRTWIVNAPAGAPARLSYRLSVRYPKNQDVVVEGR